jgi:hypothetical protein
MKRSFLPVLRFSQGATMNLNLRIVFVGILFVTLGSLGKLSIPVQGQDSAILKQIPDERMFSTILRVGNQFSASGDYASWYGEDMEGKTDLFSCEGGAAKILAEDDPYRSVIDLAIWINVLSRQLRADGTYPVAAPYLKRLIEYGDARTLRIDPKGDHGELWSVENLTLLNDMARALNTSLHRERYEVDGGCGAGEIRVLVKIPESSAALLINTFHFTLCQARGKDPWNAQACYGWKTVEKIPMLLSGAYRYVLTFTNGRKTTGDVLIDHKQEMDMYSQGLLDEDHPYVLNLK